MAEKTEKYFKAWAGNCDGFIRDCEDRKIHKRLGFNSANDLKLHIYNMFLLTMFYKCIDDQAKQLPSFDEFRSNDKSVRGDLKGNFCNDPSKWIEFYHGGVDDTMCTLNTNDGDYVIMHSGLYYNQYDIYNIFKMQSKNSTVPYNFVALSTSNDCIWRDRDAIKASVARDICNYIKLNKICKRVTPFGCDINDVIFNCEKLPNWQNDKIAMNTQHVVFDHPERKKGYKEPKIIEMCRTACQKSISNYRYAYPYVYYDDTHGFRRGFLLPLEDNDKVVFVATVMKKVLIGGRGTDSNNYHYSIEDILTNKMAIEQARRVSSVEVDWISKILAKKIDGNL